MAESHGERIARLEARLEAYEDAEESRDEDRKTILSKLEKIDNEFSRYRGFVGGILLIVTAIVTFVKMFGEQIGDFLSK